jgi:hypothetical protein
MDLRHRLVHQLLLALARWSEGKLTPDIEERPEPFRIPQRYFAGTEPWRQKLRLERLERLAREVH